MNEAARSDLPASDWLAPVIAGLIVAVPTVLFRYPPMVDLPLHEQAVAILRHLHDPAIFPPGLYIRNLGHSNQLFYLLSLAASYVIGVEPACKLVAAAAVFSIPVAGGRLAAHLGASRWVAVLLAPVALGWLYFWGLLANLLGLAALLALLPTLDDLAERPSARRAVGAILGVFVLYECHELLLILYAGASLIFAMGYRIDARATLWRVSPFFAAVAISLVEQVWVSRIITAEVSRVVPMNSPLLRKILVIPDVLFSKFDLIPYHPVACVSALSISLICAAAWRVRLPLSRSPRELLHRFRFELFGLACFTIYLAMPVNIHGATLVCHRFLAPSYAILVICLAPRGPHAALGRLTRFALATTPIGMLLLTWPAFIDVGRSVEDMDKLLPQIEMGSAVAQLETGPRAPERPDAVASVSARVLTTRGGRMLFSFVESPIFPVMFAPEHEWDEPIKRMLFDHFKFCPSQDLTRFRYVLVHAQTAGMALATALAMRPEARLVDAAGEWTLFESKLPQRSLMSPDVPAEKCPASLGARMQSALKQAQPDATNTQAVIHDGSSADAGAGVIDAGASGP